MTSQGPAGYVFAVADNAFCCWEHDHVERNVRFLSGLDTEYCWRCMRGVTPSPERVAIELPGRRMLQMSTTRARTLLRFMRSRGG